MNSVDRRLDPLYEYVYNESGLTFPQNNRLSMDRKVIELFESLSVAPSDIVAHVQKDETSWHALFDLLTVNESYFFREMRAIEYIVQACREARQKVRILCAPSSSGEESFSLLISLLKSGKRIEDIEIVGLDINSEVIVQAQSGLYAKRRVHRVSEEDLREYFVPEGDKYRLKERIRSAVRFYNYNLFDPRVKELGTFDVVFSRNMLIYFDKESAAKAEQVFYALVQRGGYLIVGHADHIPNKVGFKASLHNGHYIYEKLSSLL